MGTGTPGGPFQPRGPWVYGTQLRKTSAKSVLFLSNMRGSRWT